MKKLYKLFSYNLIILLSSNEALTGLKARVSREIRRSRIHPPTPNGYGETGPRVKTPWFSAKTDKIENFNSNKY